jgi:hypothetical protein
MFARIPGSTCDQSRSAVSSSVVVMECTHSRVCAGFGDISLVVRGAIVDVRSRVRIEICGGARRLASGMDRELLGLRRGIGGAGGRLVDSRGRQAIVGQRLGINCGK